LRRGNRSKPTFQDDRIVRRAAYRQDAAGGAYPPTAGPSRGPGITESDWAVPQGDPQRADSAWQAPFVAQPQDWYWQDGPDAEEPYGALDARGQPRRFPAFWAAVAVISLALLAVVLLAVYRAYQPSAAFAAKKAAMAPAVFFDGILVDEVPVGGMNRQQAQAALQQKAAASETSLDILLQVDDAAYRITQAEIPFERNVSPVLDEAWSIGRQGFIQGIGSASTPFDIRWRHTLQTRQEKAYFYTRVSYRYEDVRALSQAIAAQVSREPVNAVIEEFNFSTRQFKVSRDVPGRRVNPADIERALVQALDSGNYQGRLSLATERILPRVSSMDLQNSFTQLASFSTKTTSDENRNNNISLASQSVNGKTVMPGETFSFNQATGQRTIEKGYQGAPAILGGVLIDDVGGGVCQVSSTLFNAAALAGMTIVDRSPHAWPVSYLDRGLDAAVNWPNLDLKFRNDKDTPVFLVAYYSKRAVHVEVYGMLSAPGEAVRLETQQISSTPPPLEPVMQANPSLPYNTTKELKKARTGYVVDTYRVFLRNGAEYRREKLFTSRYPMVQQVIEYN